MKWISSAFAIMKELFCGNDYFKLFKFNKEPVFLDS